jgi:hypothetical protein
MLKFVCDFAMYANFMQSLSGSINRFTSRKGRLPQTKEQLILNSTSTCGPRNFSVILRLYDEQMSPDTRAFSVPSDFTAPAAVSELFNFKKSDQELSRV